MLCTCGGQIENIRDEVGRGSIWKHQTSPAYPGDKVKFDSMFVGDIELRKLGGDYAEAAYSHPAGQWLDALHDRLYLTTPPPSVYPEFPSISFGTITGSTASTSTNNQPKRRKASVVPPRDPVTKRLAELNLPVIHRSQPTPLSE